MQIQWHLTRLLFGVLGIGILAVLFCSGGCEKPTKPTPIRPIRTIKVGDLHGLTSQTFPGQAAAGEEVNLSFRVGGPLVRFPVKVGQQVQKGEVLAQIDPRDYEVALQSAKGNLAQAKASLDAMKAGARPEEILQLRSEVSKAQAIFEQAVAELKRREPLVAKNVVTQEEYESHRQAVKRAEANLEHAKEALQIGQAGARKEDIQAKQSEILSLQADVDNAQNRLDYTTLRAPFSGTIAATYVENFQTVAPNEDILRLLDTSQIKLEIHVPEQSILLLEYVDKIYCRFRALQNREFEAQIDEIGTEASATTRTYPVTLLVEQPTEGKRIMPGMAGVVHGTAKKEALAKLKSLQIPETAVFSSKEGETCVWIFDPDTQTVHTREVQIGGTTPLGLRVSGVKPGEIIATAGVHYLTDGQKVRLLPDSKSSTPPPEKNVAEETASGTPNSDREGGNQP